MDGFPTVKLYGSVKCHKTQYYRELLAEMEVPFEFLDVVSNQSHALELRGLYTNGRLNFPTITIDQKKLRNPTRKDLLKWLNKLTPSRFTPKEHDDNSSTY